MRHTFALPATPTRTVERNPSPVGGTRDVILLIRNEEATLRGRVEALCDILADEGTSFRLWLLDNGSTDATPEVACDLARSLPQIRFAGDGGAGGLAVAIDSLRRQLGTNTVVLGNDGGALGRSAQPLARQGPDGLGRVHSSSDDPGDITSADRRPSGRRPAQHARSPPNRPTDASRLDNRSTDSRRRRPRAERTHDRSTDNVVPCRIGIGVRSHVTRCRSQS